jgi:hypothetical protein
MHHTHCLRTLVSATRQMPTARAHCMSILVQTFVFFLFVGCSCQESSGTHSVLVVNCEFLWVCCPPARNAALSAMFVTVLSSSSCSIAMSAMLLKLWRFLSTAAAGVVIEWRRSFLQRSSPTACVNTLSSWGISEGGMGDLGQLLPLTFL